MRKLIFFLFLYVNQVFLERKIQIFSDSIPISVWPLKEDLKIQFSGKKEKELQINLSDWPKSFRESDYFHKSELEKPCIIKQGYMGWAKKTENKKDYELKPIFTVMNYRSISFFQGEDVFTLLDSINVKNLIIEDKKKFSKIHCFQISTRRGDFQENLCFDSEKRKLNWISSIEKFKGKSCEKI